MPKYKRKPQPKRKLTAGEWDELYRNHQEYPTRFSIAGIANRYKLHPKTVELRFKAYTQQEEELRSIPVPPLWEAHHRMEELKKKSYLNRDSVVKTMVEMPNCSAPFPVIKWVWKKAVVEE